MKESVRSKLYHLRFLLGVIFTYSVPIAIVAACYFSIAEEKLNRKYQNYASKDKFENSDFGLTGNLLEHERLGFDILYVRAENDSNNFFAASIPTKVNSTNDYSNIISNYFDYKTHTNKFTNFIDTIKSYTMIDDINVDVSDELTKYYFSSPSNSDFKSVLPMFLDSLYNISNDSNLLNQKIEEFQDVNQNQNAVKRTPNSNTEASNTEKSQYDIIKDSILSSMVKTISRNEDSKSSNIVNRDEIISYLSRIYSPSNTLFYYYGSMSESELLSYLDSLFVNYTRTEQNILPPHTYQNTLKTTLSKKVSGHFPDLKDNEKISTVSWLIKDISGLSEAVDMDLLSRLIYDENCPKKSLLYKHFVTDNKYAQGVCNNTGFHHDDGVSYYTVCLEGVSSSLEVTPLVLAFFQKISTTPSFDTTDALSTIQKYEINRTEIKESLGKDIFNRVIGPWSHSVPSLSEYVSISWEFERIRQVSTVQSKYFEMVLAHRIVNNVDRLAIDFVRDPESEPAAKKKVTAEPQTVYDDIASQHVNMREFPITNFDRLALEIKERAKNVGDERGVSPSENLFVFEEQLNNMVYVRFKSAVPITDKNIRHLPYFLEIFGKLGAGTAENTESKTGSKKYDTESLTVRPEIFNNTLSIVVEGKSMLRNANNMIDSIQALLLNPILSDTESVARILKQKYQQMTKEINGSPEKYASLFSSSSFTTQSALNELIYGVTFYRNLYQTVKSENWKEAISNCKDAYEQVFLMGNFSAAVHCGKGAFKKYEGKINLLLMKLNRHKTAEKSANYMSTFINDMRVWSKTLLKTGSSTGFICFAYKFDIDEKKAVFLNVLSKLINRTSGFMTAYDQNDPTVLKILCECDLPSYTGLKQVIDEKQKEILKISQNLDLTNNSFALFKSKLDVFKETDRKQVPDMKGMSVFLHSISYKSVLEKCVDVLKTKDSDISYVVNMMNDNTKCKKNYVFIGTTKYVSDTDNFNMYDTFANKSK